MKRSANAMENRQERLSREKTLNLLRRA